MDDSPACLFFLTVYAATSNRGCLPARRSRGGSRAHGGNPVCMVTLQCPMRLVGQGENKRVPPSWKVTLGEEAVFAEVARVESIHAAMPATRSCNGEKATSD